MGAVSRETILTAFFPRARWDLVSRYAERLASDGVTRGLIGPREVDRLWERHLGNCAAVAEVVPAGATVADVGTGAGLPGLVLALARPDLRVTLIEPLLRRTTFLLEVVADLELSVEVVRARAEELHGERRFDVVTSRAVAPLPRLAGWCMPLVAGPGAMLAMKGSSAQAEVDACAAEFERAGYAPAEVATVGESSLDIPTHVVRLAWAEPGQVGWPPTTTRGSRVRSARHGRGGGPARSRRSRS